MRNISTSDVVMGFCKPEVTLKFSLSQWSIFIFILRENQILARFYHLSIQDHVFERFPKKVQQHLLSAKVQANRQANQAKFEAFTLTKQLADIDKKPIFLKGVAYTLLGNCASRGRTYSDMDVLVNKQDIKTIEQKLTMHGWFAKEIDDYDEKYYREWAHEIPPLQQHIRGTIADIHHNLIPPISGRAPDISLFTAELMQTTSNLATLSNHGLVLHSIIHLFFNEDFSHAFRDVTDLHLLFTEQHNNEKFWLSLLQLSQKTGFTRELYFAVRYCQKITKTEFPSSFILAINKFQPPSLKLSFHDFIFIRVLNPRHSSLDSWQTNVAELLATIRGHLLKMPLHILLYHSCHKLSHSIYNLVKKDKQKKSFKNLN